MHNFTHKLPLALLLGTALVTACEDEYEYTPKYDLFQPRMIDLDKNADGNALIEGNTVRLMWYKVNNAVSYTIEVCTNNNYSRLVKSYDVAEPTVFIEDIPYGTQFYIRIRSNAADNTNNSYWTKEEAKTEDRPEFAQILKEVTDIGDEGATVSWTVDPDNPVDSISVYPMASDTLKSVSRYLTEAEMTAGKATFTGLDKNTLYAVDLFDNNKPGRYDKPYNQLTFRTTGPAVDPIEITRFDDLSKILNDNNNDPSIPEGVEYRLPAGSYYQINPFGLQKGFKLVGETGGDPVQIEMSRNWDIAAASSATAKMIIASVEFENIEFLQTVDASYFFNNSCSFDIKLFSFRNCKFSKFARGFWRQKDVHDRHIQKIVMDNCIMDECFGYSGGTYGTFNFEKDGNSVDSVIITNTTIMRELNESSNLFNYSKTSAKIHLEISNCTFYRYCAKKQKRLIDLNNVGAPSELIIKNVLFATNCGQISRQSANTAVTLENNYATSDCKRGVKEYRTDKNPDAALTITADELFVDGPNGDLTIKDPESPIVKNRVGDPRWLP